MAVWERSHSHCSEAAIGERQQRVHTGSPVELLLNGGFRMVVPALSARTRHSLHCKHSRYWIGPADRRSPIELTPIGDAAHFRDDT